MPLATALDVRPTTPTIGAEVHGVDLGPVDAAGTDFDRRVERVTIAGERAVGPDGFVSEPLEGELFS